MTRTKKNVRKATGAPKGAASEAAPARREKKAKWSTLQDAAFVRLLLRINRIYQAMSHARKGGKEGRKERIAQARAALGPRAGGPDNLQQAEIKALKTLEQEIFDCIRKDFRACRDVDIADKVKHLDSDGLLNKFSRKQMAKKKENLKKKQSVRVRVRRAQRAPPPPVSHAFPFPPRLAH
jgi:hypothetical protein